MKARDALFDTADNLRDVIDSYVELMKVFLTKVPESSLLNTTGKLFWSTYLEILIDSLSLNHIAADKKRIRFGTTICIGLTLMTMYCPMAQTRVGDRGGLYFIYNFAFEKENVTHSMLAQWASCCIMVSPQENQNFYLQFCI